MISNTTDLSIIIPHYGDAGPTHALLQRLENQDYPHSYEVIVVDDCSPVPLTLRSEGVKVVRLPKNVGFGSAVNCGVDVASSRSWILVLNSDLLPESSFLTRLMGCVEGESDARRAVHGVRILDPRGNDSYSLNRFPRIRDVFIDKCAPVEAASRRLAARRATENVRLDLAPPGDYWISGAVILLSRDAFMLVEGFDEGFFMYWEDVDLQWRLARLGVAAKLHPEVSITHVGGASSNSDQVRQWALNGQFRYFTKRGRRYSLAAAWVTVLGLNLAYDTARRLIGKETSPLGTLMARSHALRVALQSSAGRTPH